MPGILSHYLCAAAAHESLSGEIYAAINEYRKVYNIGTQGPDVFFYYFPYIFRKKDNIGSVMHRKNTGKLIENLIFKADSLKGEERLKAFVYIAGYLTHYSLDANAHPYIYYKTGTASRKRKKIIIHSVCHRRFETAIDSSLLKPLKDVKPSQQLLYKLIKVERADVRLIGSLLSYGVLKTYRVKLGEREAERAIKYMWRANMLLQSRLAMGKRLISAIEEGIIGNKLSSAVFYDEMKSRKTDYLNLNKESWFLPWNHKEEKKESFTELFFKSAEESAKLIALLFGFMNRENSREELMAAVGSRSLLSGLDDGSNPEFYCFEENSIKAL